jgi:hypothetical protein
MKDDIMAWLGFLETYNGQTPFPSAVWSTKEALNLFTDSCGYCGGGAFFYNHWTVIIWPSIWSSDISRDITLLELVPILTAIWVWPDLFTSKKVGNQHQQFSIGSYT